MKKKTIVLIIISIVGFIGISTAVFALFYSLTSTLIRANPNIITEITKTDEANQPNQASEAQTYSVLTKKLLESLSDDELEQAIVDHIWVYKVKEDYDKEYEIVKSLPQGMKYLYSTWVLELETEDNGFAQFFDNYSTDFTKEAIDGYRYFGANEQADVVAKAVGAYYKKGQRDFKELDNEFNKNADRAIELRVKYIKEHIDEFVTQ